VFACGLATRPGDDDGAGCLASGLVFTLLNQQPIGQRFLSHHYFTTLQEKHSKSMAEFLLKNFK